MTRYLYTAVASSVKDTTLGEFNSSGNRLFGCFIKDKNYIIILEGAKIYASGFYKVLEYYFKGKKQKVKTLGIGYFKFPVEKHIAKKYLKFIEKTEVKTKNKTF